MYGPPKVGNKIERIEITENPISFHSRESLAMAKQTQTHTEIEGERAL